MDRRAISFGPFSLHAEQRLLLEGDRPVRLGSRAFDILTALVERAGEVVRHEGLIGREDAVAALVSRLSRHRMVTIVGPGGIGKTTLAVAVAEQQACRYQLVCFVDLGSLRDKALVASALASALNLPTLSDKPIQAV